MDYAVMYDSEELARYPERQQAEIYADGWTSAKRTFDPEEDGTASDRATVEEVPENNMVAELGSEGAATYAEVTAYLVAIVAALSAKGTPATLEYPGSICIDKDGINYWLGDIGDTWGGQGYSIADKGQENGVIHGSLDTGLSVKERDPDTVADAIIRALTTNFYQAYTLEDGSKPIRGAEHVFGGNPVCAYCGISDTDERAEEDCAERLR